MPSPATQRIWAQLSEDLLFSCVLCRLPSEDVVRCQAVCRLWKKRIRSPSFQLQRSKLKGSPSFQAYREEPWLLILDDCTGECCAYNPRSNRWHKLCIGGPPTWCHPSPVAAAGGILVYVLEGAHDAVSESYDPNNHRTHKRYDIPALRLAVCNPFTKSWKELPPMTHKYRAKPFVGAIDLHGSARFNVVVAGGRDVDGNCHSSTEVYDSSTDSWSVSMQMMREEDAWDITESWCSQSGVVCQDGILYCITKKYNGALDVSSLMSYDLVSGMWRRDYAYNVQRGVWDRLKWRMEGVSDSLSLMKSSRSPQGLMLAGGYIGCPVYLWPLAFSAASGLLRWTEEMREPLSASLEVGQQRLASARTLYFFNTCFDFEVEKWDYASSSFSSPTWTSLRASPLPPRHLHRRAVAFLVEPL